MTFCVASRFARQESKALRWKVRRCDTAEQVDVYKILVNPGLHVREESVFFGEPTDRGLLPHLNAIDVYAKLLGRWNKLAGIQLDQEHPVGPGLLLCRGIWLLIALVPWRTIRAPR